MVLLISCIQYLLCGAASLVAKQYPFVVGDLHGKVRVSSEWKVGGKVNRGSHLFDQDPTTSWAPDPSDPDPTILITFARKAPFEGVAFEFGWKESQFRYLMNLPIDPFYQRTKIYGIRKADSIELEFVAEVPRVRCSPGFPFDGSTQKRMSRMDVLPYEFRNDTIRIKTNNTIAEIRFLRSDSASSWIAPPSIKSLMRSNRWPSQIPFPVQNICALKSTTWGCSELEKLKSFGLCSPYLLSKNVWSNFKRVMSGVWNPYLSYRLYQDSGRREVWLPRAAWEWESVDMDEDGVDIRPLAELYKNRDDRTQFSYPVLKISTSGGIDSGFFTNPYALEKGPEWVHQYSVAQRELIDTSGVIQDTQSIRIGGQVWMKRNLYQSSQNKSSICLGMSVKDTGKWNRNCIEYGRLYSYRNVKSICPTNWHVPSPKEWMVLFRFIQAHGSSKFAIHRLNHFGADSKLGSGMELLSPLRWVDHPDSSWDPWGFDAKMVQIFPPPQSGVSIVRSYWDAELLAKFPQFMSSGIAHVETNEKNGCNSDPIPECYDIPAVQLGVEKGDSEAISDIEQSQKDLRMNVQIEPGLYFPVRCIHD